MTKRIIYQRINGTKKTTSEKEKENRNGAEKLDELAQKSDRVLLKVKTVFPFNFFSDEVIVDESKVTVKQGFFFYSGQVRSVAYEDIFNVVTEYGLLFATLEIVDRFFAHSPLLIPFLKTKDARKIRRIIQGMIIAKREGIDFLHIEKDELLQKVEILGMAEDSSKTPV